jgi:hypothetical protein
MGHSNWLNDVGQTIEDVLSLANILSLVVIYHWATFYQLEQFVIGNSKHWGGSFVG